MNIEQDANCVADATSKLEDTIDWSKALNPYNDDNVEEYSKAAEAIVEPEGVGDEYYDMAENDPDNWASWMREIAGEKWGNLATLVNEYGY